jgi:gluconate 2-dehydrogenase gamma chain
MEQAIDRREALRRAALVLGASLAAPTIAGVLAGCEARGTAIPGGWTPRSLTADEHELVLTIAEHIIPETDTPGARAARVHEFIDTMLADYHPPEIGERVRAGLRRLDGRAHRLHGFGFLDCSHEEQLALLEPLDRAAFADAAHEAAGRSAVADGADGRSGGVGVGDRIFDEPHPEDDGTESFFRTIKELTVVGYYTSRIGATEELRINPMGSFRADMDYSEIGRAWA